MTITAPRVSAIRPHVEQESFYRGDYRHISPAAIRQRVGAFFEEATRLYFRAEAHQTDNRVDLCPDFHVPGRPREYLEVKSIGRHRQGIIYQRSIDHYAAAAKAGAAVTFVFWIHNVEVMQTTGLNDLRHRLAAGVDRVLVVPFDRLRLACRRMTARPIQYRSPDSHGRGDSIILPGYRLSWTLLQELAAGHGIGTGIRLPDQVVHGHHMGGVTLYGPDIARAMPPLTEAERNAAGGLLFDLSRERLQVELREAPHKQHATHCVRCVVNRNPAWYRDLCARVGNWRTKPKNRRVPDTGIKRHRVERALERLARGEVRTSIDWMLLPIVRRFATYEACHD